MSKYTASLIGGQNIVFRPFIEVNDRTIRFKIPGFLSGEEQTMQLENITDIKIAGTIISKTIEIYSVGMGVIVAEGFSPSDARSIKSDIETNKQRLKEGKSNRKRYEVDEDDWDDDIEEEEAIPKKPVARKSSLDERIFTDVNKIPLLTFSKEPQEIISTLNTLLHFDSAIISSKDFKSFEVYKEKHSVYQMKINEGLRLAKSLKSDEYLKSEIKRIENERVTIESRAKEKLNKKNGKVFKYIILFVIAFVVFKTCKQIF